MFRILGSILVVSLALVSAQAQVQRSRSNAISLDLSKTQVFAPPVITWVAPAVADSISTTAEVVVRAGVSCTLSVTKVALLVNGMPVPKERSPRVVAREAVDYAAFVERIVELKEGANQVEVVAENEKGERTVLTRRMVYRKPSVDIAKRNDHALIFATNDYDDWQDLTNPVFDATAIAKELTEHYGFKVELIINPTTSQMLGKIREYGRRTYLPDDQLFIFFAGHGQFDDVFTEGYIVAKNSKKSDDAKESYISHSSLRTIVSNLPCQHIFLTMDVCFGGTFDQAIAKAGTRGSDDDMYQDITQQEFLQRKLRFKTRKYLTSGGKQYVPDGRAGQHSPFARKFLEALRSYGGKDKVLTLGEIVNYVEVISPEPKFGDFPGDEPGSDFLFVAKK